MVHDLRIIVDLDALELAWAAVAGHRDPEPGRDAAHERGDVGEVFRRTLVHRDERVLEPPLLLEVLREVDEKITPVFVEERLARPRLGADLPAVGVDVVDHVAPRAHGVACDVGTKPALPAELHVLVEDGVVERPFPVRIPAAADHRAVRVVALVVPGLVDERDRERLLTGGGEHLPERLHRGVVLGRERLHAVDARDGPRMLPEVEEVFPLARRRQDAVEDLHLELAEIVLARLRVRRGRNGREMETRRLRSIDCAIGDEPVFKGFDARVVPDGQESAAAHRDPLRFTSDFRELVGHEERRTLAAPDRHAHYISPCCNARTAHRESQRHPTQSVHQDLLFPSVVFWILFYNGIIA